MSDRNVVTDNVQAQTKPIMEFIGITKYFGGVQALKDVNMEIYPSKVIALVGDNGAGKSTFLKIISGINIPDAGTIKMDGEPIKIKNARHSTSLGIQTVYQDLALCDNLDTVANLFLGRELVWKNWRLNRPLMRQTAIKYFKELGIELSDVNTPVGQLSGGQRQAVAIARSMLGNPRIVLLDEPLANLGFKQRRQVSSLIKCLRSKGYGIVVVSHDLIEVFEVADHVVVFRLGEKVAEIERNDIEHRNVVREITGGKIDL